MSYSARDTGEVKVKSICSWQGDVCAMGERCKEGSTELRAAWRRFLRRQNPLAEAGRRGREFLSDKNGNFLGR